jgi:Ty3 transposon capsid-like protein
MGKEKARSFSGTTGEDAANWLLHYSRVAEANDWDTDEKKLKHVALFLIGEAENWFNANQGRFESTEARWTDFVNEFKERFQPALYRITVEEQLLNIAQRQGESVRAYYERFSLLKERLGADGLAGSVLQTRWIRGLQNPLRKHVLVENPRDLREAFDKAVEAERIELTMALGGNTSQKTNLATTYGERQGEAQLQVEDSDRVKYAEFAAAMGPEVAEDAPLAELITRFKAWQLFSLTYKDPLKLRGAVLNASKSQSAFIEQSGGKQPNVQSSLQAKSEAPRRTITCYKMWPSGSLQKGLSVVQKTRKRKRKKNRPCCERQR